MKRFLTGCWAIIKTLSPAHINEDCTLVWNGRTWVHDSYNLLDEANRYVEQRNEWQQRISNALSVTWQELHGGGATIYGTLEDCERRIQELVAERDKGWQAAYQRGLAEGLDEPWSPTT